MDLVTLLVIPGTKALLSLAAHIVLYTLKAFQAWVFPDLPTTLRSLTVLVALLLGLSYSGGRLRARRLWASIVGLYDYSLLPIVFVWNSVTATLRGGLAYVIAYTLLALLLVQGATVYFDLFVQTACQMQGVSYLPGFRCEARDNTATQWIQTARRHSPPRCSPFAEWSSKPSPRLTHSLAISRDIVSNASSWPLFASSTENELPFRDLALELHDTLTGLRGLLGMTNNVVSVTDRTIAEWAPRVRGSGFRRALCFAVAVIHSCSEPALTTRLHKSMLQSLLLMREGLAKATSAAREQLEALLSVHNLLSRAWETALIEEFTAERSSWHPFTANTNASRADAARAVRFHCNNLRCTMQIAMDATRELLGTLNALDASADAPAAELAELRIALGGVVDRRDAVQEAYATLQQLFI
ncbi:hypothetical protein AURDEDRAFT_177409 [Auricularia subglabra TFB-10046 SS5]|uniref:Uncharacterized protein n=1 Tax=Auricularia subglabra (strain TFB-10046 / SS5) TaxID=717982 RepID=J0LAR4_AURST|nr:hypothetical protein AURDEDRAFT_177409 [Auricularia subglabra TFB-10046 SS5]